MNAIILSIGDELVLGQTVDTNSAWLSAQLAAVGCGVVSHLTVPDDQPAIERAIRNAVPECEILLVSGGLGPTEDDLTRQALAAVMNQPLELNAEWMAELERFFAARNRAMPPINRIQAMIPRGAKMIFNTAGTASGIEATLPRSPREEDARTPGRQDAGTGIQATSAPADTDQRTPQRASASISASPRLPVSASNPPPSSPCKVFVMPGVPKEMKIMFQRDVLPHIREAGGGAVILSRTLHTFGMGESAIAQMLGNLMHRGRNPSVGTTVSNGVVSLRVNSRFDSQAEAARELDETVAACRAALGALIYGQDEQTLAEVVGRMLKSAAGNPTLATAESCTGGLLGKMITDVPGSSSYFSHGWITYANQAKQQLLGVPANLLDQHGAVSEQVVLAMAAGARSRANSTFALAISGVAGPDGGTPAKPVGTVCIALAHPAAAAARTFLFPGDREFIRDRSAKMALTLLRFHLLGVPPPF